MNYLPAINGLFKGLARYHQHSVIGLENIPAAGPALIVANHSLATYDTGLLWHAIVKASDRTPFLLADRALFKIPIVKSIVESYGSVEGDPKTARKLLADGQIVVVNPGGMREALMPSSRKYELDLQDRKGFVRLAIDCQVPVILSACPAADDIYTVYDSPVTKRVYDKFKLPVPIATGALGTAIPRKARLTHYLSKPISPPSPPPENYNKAVDLFHVQLHAQLQSMMSEWPDEIDQNKLGQS